MSKMALTVTTHDNFQKIHARNKERRKKNQRKIFYVHKSEKKFNKKRENNFTAQKKVVSF